MRRATDGGVAARNRHHGRVFAVLQCFKPQYHMLLERRGQCMFFFYFWQFAFFSSTLRLFFVWRGLVLRTTMTHSPLPFFFPFSCCSGVY
jgi:hypothetical protein